MVELNSAHPLFSVTKNRALIISFAILESLLLTGFNKEEGELIRKFLADRDKLISELLHSKKVSS